MKERGQAAPAEHELGQRSVTGAGPQPEPDPPADRPDPAPLLGAAAKHRRVEQHGGEDKEQRRADNDKRTLAGSGEQTGDLAEQQVEKKDHGESDGEDEEQRPAEETTDHDA